MRKKGKLEELFNGTSLINISDEDLISRPHGFAPSSDMPIEEFEEIIKEFRKIGIKIKKSINLPEAQRLHRWCNYDYDTRTFTAQQNTGQPVALTFRDSQKGRRSSQAILFEVGYELWEANKTELERSEVLRRCQDKVKKYGIAVEVNSEWLKDTRINLRRTVELSQVKNLIRIFDYDKSKPQLFYFSINRPT